MYLTEDDCAKAALRRCNIESSCIYSRHCVYQTVLLYAHAAQEGSYVISPTEKGNGKRKRGWRLRHCDDALSTSSSLIACTTVRFASRSPWKPAEKPIDSLSLDYSERELFQESRGPFPLLSYPHRISLVFAREELSPLPPAYLIPARPWRSDEGKKKKKKKARRRRRRRRRERRRRGGRRKRRRARNGARRRR